MTFLEFFNQWWHFIVFALTTFIAFLLGRERQRFKVDQIGKEQEKQGRRIENLEKQGTEEALQVREILTTQGHILTELKDIKLLVSNKVDK